MNPTSEPSQPRKPRLALLIATGFGLGKMPWAPGSWGSLLGLALAWALRRHELENPFLHRPFIAIGDWEIDPWVFWSLFVVLCVAVLGVWTSKRATKYIGKSDPQSVVIDEVSGQMIALLGAGWLRDYSSDAIGGGARFIALMAPSWKYLVLGFILFRAFDIWKPFPARRAERLPGGWGIMADDWVAGVYAALGLWAARALGM